LLSTSDNRTKKYRSKQEIVHDILNACPDRKGHIMFKAYLSFTELKEYLQELQQLELIDYNEETRVFNLTDKGARYVRVFDRMKGLTNEKAV
jgi:predicted transcriptional regulator